MARMQLFGKSDPRLNAERDLAAKTAKRTDIANRLRLAEARVIECQNVARSLAAHAATDEKLDDAEAEQLKAEKRVANLAAGLADVDAEVVAQTAEIERLIDQAMRVQTAAAIGETAEKWGTVAAAVDAALGKLVEISHETAPIILDAYGLQAFSQDCRAQIPPAITVIVNGLRAHAASVLNGTMRPSLPVPDKPMSLSLPPPRTRTVFALKNLVYTDADGRQHRLPKVNDAELPEHLAAEAVRRGIACEASDPRRKQKGVFGALTPALANCVALDNTVTEAAAKVTAIPTTPPILHSAFEAEKIGAPIVGVMRATPVAVGARTLPEE